MPNNEPDVYPTASTGNAFTAALGRAIISRLDPSPGVKFKFISSHVMVVEINVCVCNVGSVAMGTAMQKFTIIKAMTVSKVRRGAILFFMVKLGMG